MDPSIHPSIPVLRILRADDSPILCPPSLHGYMCLYTDCTIPYHVVIYATHVLRCRPSSSPPPRHCRAKLRPRSRRVAVRPPRGGAVVGMGGRESPHLTSPSTQTQAQAQRKHACICPLILIYIHLYSALPPCDAMLCMQCNAVICLPCHTMPPCHAMPYYAFFPPPLLFVTSLIEHTFHQSHRGIIKKTCPSSLPPGKPQNTTASLPLQRALHVASVCPSCRRRTQLQ